LATLRQILGVAKILTLGTRAIEAYLQHRFVLETAYRPRPDDVFIVGYPKSGSSLMQMMLYQLATDGAMDFPHIDTVAPWFEMALHGGLHKYLEGLASPRIFKCHLTYGLMPKGVRSIYVAREVRDVAVSAYHHNCLEHGYDLELEPFINTFLRGKMFFGSWFKHIKSWWPHRNDPNVLFLRYEEIIADIPGTARTVAGFCSWSIDEEKMARVVERCSLSFMKQHDAKFDPRLHQCGRNSRRFIRNGVPGEGEKLFTPAQENEVNRRLARLAHTLDCSPGEPHHELLLLGARTSCASQPVRKRNEMG
jgi:hypothetical protein